MGNHGENHSSDNWYKEELLVGRTVVNLLSAEVPLLHGDEPFQDGEEA